MNFTKFNEMINEGKKDIYSDVLLVIQNYQFLKDADKVELDDKMLEYYETFYSDIVTSDELKKTLEEDIKDWDVDYEASDGFVEIYGENNAAAELELLKKMLLNVDQLTIHRQVILLEALETMLNFN